MLNENDPIVLFTVPYAMNSVKPIDLNDSASNFEFYDTEKGFRSGTIYVFPMAQDMRKAGI
jgi:hypothetical protein